MSEEFPLKYRPKTFNEVFGQKHVVSALKEMFDNDKAPSKILLSGPSGCGKTTIGRIIANEYGCSPSNILEINAANANGVDSMRELIKFMEYPAMGSNPLKVIILDECHKITGSARDAALKPFEEPPPFIKIILCTTEIGSVPQTFKRRFKHFELTEVGLTDLCTLMEKIAKKEKINRSSEDIKFIARAASGCPSDAVNLLEITRYCKNKDDIASLISSHVEEKDVIHLCKLLASNKPSWKDALDILKDLKGKNPESVRIPVANYLTSCVLGAKTEQAMVEFARRLDCFSKPVYNTQAFYEIILATVEVVNG